jgi:hypothetical protein
MLPGKSASNTAVKARDDTFLKRCLDFAKVVVRMIHLGLRFGPLLVAYPFSGLLGEEVWWGWYVGSVERSGTKRHINILTPY